MALSRPLLLSRLLPSRLALSRASSSSSLLVNDRKYQFLQDLGLKENNCGVFDGEWKGSGEVSGVLCEEPNLETKMKITIIAARLVRIKKNLSIEKSTPI